MNIVLGNTIRITMIARVNAETLKSRTYCACKQCRAHNDVGTSDKGWHTLQFYEELFEFVKNETLDVTRQTVFLD